MSDDQGGGSLTALPIIETQANDVSDYIPTNVISITDGQIFLETDLFNAGQRPAMNVGISVSRVGGNAQVRAMRTAAGGLKLELAQYREVEAFSQFGSDLDRATQEQLANGERLTMMLRQPQYNPLAVEQQVVQIYAATPQETRDSWVRKLPVEDVLRFADELIQFMESRHSQILEEIRSSGQLSDELIPKLEAALDAFVEIFQPSSSVE
jgi:F-type H+-transporting ATPase subunit alpha